MGVLKETMGFDGFHWSFERNYGGLMGFHGSFERNYVDLMDFMGVLKETMGI